LTDAAFSGILSVSQGRRAENTRLFSFILYLVGEITGNKVKLTYILKSIRARWNNKEPHIHLEAWDPELMHAWVKRTYQTVKFGEYEGQWPAEISKDKKSYHLTLDMSERETPTGTYWQY
jgi:hypothetical protein